MTTKLKSGSKYKTSQGDLVSILIYEDNMVAIKYLGDEKKKIEVDLDTAQEMAIEQQWEFITGPADVTWPD